MNNSIATIFRRRLGAGKRSRFFNNSFSTCGIALAFCIIGCHVSEPELGYSYNSEANSIFVSKGDVYVAGTQFYDPNFPANTSINATLWKNNAVYLQHGSYSLAASVFCADNDVYALGMNFPLIDQFFG